MTDKMIKKLFDLRQTAQNKFYEIAAERPIIQLSQESQVLAMYFKGKEEAFSHTLSILELE